MSVCPCLLGLLCLLGLSVSVFVCRSGRVFLSVCMCVCVFVCVLCVCVCLCVCTSWGESGLSENSKTTQHRRTFRIKSRLRIAALASRKAGRVAMTLRWTARARRCLGRSRLAMCGVLSRSPPLASASPSAAAATGSLSHCCLVCSVCTFLRIVLRMDFMLLNSRGPPGRLRSGWRGVRREGLRATRPHTVVCR